MNHKIARNRFIHSLWLAAVLSTALLPMTGLPAQPVERKANERFLLIFDTSSNMKRRVPAVEKALNAMLATSLNGQLHKGDTIGVWTFDQDLHAGGGFPLQAWNPEHAVLLASNLTQFVHSRKYANATRFEALQPLLNRVVESSERLTVLIFSDGVTKITGTTFDTGINQLFEQNAAAQKKAHEPFVVVLRSQKGKYVGCTVSLPPQLVSFPQFPPLPLLPEPPPPPKPAPVPVPAPAPVAVAPSMIIHGTKVEPMVTNPPPAISPAPAPVAPIVPPDLPPAAVPAATSNAPVVVSDAPTNPVVTAPVNPPVPPPTPVVIPPANLDEPASAPAPVTATAPVVPTNAQTLVLTNHPAVAAASPAGMDKRPLIIGAICLLAAGVLTALIFFCFRRPDRGSLISRSMHDK